MPDLPPPNSSHSPVHAALAPSVVRRKLVLHAIVAVVVMAGLLVLGRFLSHHAVPRLEDWVERQGPWGPVVYLSVFMVNSLCMGPADLFAIPAGLLFGLWRGIFVMFIGEFVAGLMLFLIARYLARARVERFLEKHPKFRAVDRAAGKQGVKFLMLLRLAPIPFAPLSYVLGISGVKFRTYAVSLIALLPGVVVAVFCGYVAKHLTKTSAEDGHARWLEDVGLAAGVFVTLLLIAYIGRIALQALKEAAEEGGENNKGITPKSQG